MVSGIQCRDSKVVMVVCRQVVGLLVEAVASRLGEGHKLEGSKTFAD